MTTYRMSLFSAGSISLDSTFKGIGHHLEVGGREYTHSIPTGKLEARIFLNLILKGLLHKISKKPLDAA
jgi:hypothetical protein